MAESSAQVDSGRAEPAVRLRLWKFVSFAMAFFAASRPDAARVSACRLDSFWLLLREQYMQLAIVQSLYKLALLLVKIGRALTET